MALYWTYPSNFQIELYRSGWKSDKSFTRIVADIGGGRYAAVSSEEMEFVIKANTINKVRQRDIAELLIPRSTGNSQIGPDTQLDGIRLSRGDTLLGGISLFDDWRKAPITSDTWYAVPTTLTVPKGLIVVRATRPSAAGAFHFTLGPAEPMTLRHFIVLLSPLADDSRIVRVQ